jgi:hypothetical protein
MTESSKPSGPQGLKPSSLLTRGDTTEEAAERVEVLTSALKGRLFSKDLRHR